jgi:uncharacterized protein YeeX (DUF496 family)
MKKNKSERIKKGMGQESKEKMINIEMTPGDVENLLNNSYDERFDYLVKNGEITKQSHQGKKMLVRLQQIPKTLVFYRKDSLRMRCPKV